MEWYLFDAFPDLASKQNGSILPDKMETFPHKVQVFPNKMKVFSNKMKVFPNKIEVDFQSQWKYLAIFGSAFWKLNQ